MVKRDAMVQLDKQYLSLDPVDKENAEYPFAHVHTQGGDNVDPITREPVNVLKGYAQHSFLSLDPVDKDNAEYPFAHVHTQGGDDVDPMTREPVNVLRDTLRRNNLSLMRIQSNMFTPRTVLMSTQLPDRLPIQIKDTFSRLMV